MLPTLGPNLFPYNHQNRIQNRQDLSSCLTSAWTRYHLDKINTLCEQDAELESHNLRDPVQWLELTGIGFVVFVARNIFKDSSLSYLSYFYNLVYYEVIKLWIEHATHGGVFVGRDSSWFLIVFLFLECRETQIY
jgi:hypothetical protein